MTNSVTWLLYAIYWFILLSVSTYGLMILLSPFDDNYNIEQVADDDDNCFDIRLWERCMRNCKGLRIYYVDDLSNLQMKDRLNECYHYCLQSKNSC